MQDDTASFYQLLCPLLCTRYNIQHSDGTKMTFEACHLMNNGKEKGVRLKKSPLSNPTSITHDLFSKQTMSFFSSLYYLPVKDRRWKRKLPWRSWYGLMF